jgi:hypothetical protein
MDGAMAFPTEGYEVFFCIAAQLASRHDSAIRPAPKLIDAMRRTPFDEGGLADV